VRTLLARLEASEEALNDMQDWASHSGLYNEKDYMEKSKLSIERWRKAAGK